MDVGSRGLCYLCSKNKGADQPVVTLQLICVFVFVYLKSGFLMTLNQFTVRLFSGSRLDATISGSQKSQFQDFLLRANKYNTLDIFGDSVSSKKIVFVEVNDYDYTPMQYTAIFHGCKNDYF